MTMTMKDKYLKSINAIVTKSGNYDIERSISFANEVSQYANDHYKLNAAATTSEGDALIDALDEYFN